MTPRGAARVSVPKAKSADYAAVAESFQKGAETAKEFDYWNAAGVLIVHAAIAFTDAVTIRIAGVKSRGEDHMAAVDLLKSVVLMDDRGRKAAGHLTSILEQKNLVSYSGEVYRNADIDRLWKHLERYRSWAISLLGHLP